MDSQKVFISLFFLVLFSIAFSSAQNVLSSPFIMEYTAVSSTVGDISYLVAYDSSEGATVHYHQTYQNTTLFQTISLSLEKACYWYPNSPGSGCYCEPWKSKLPEVFWKSNSTIIGTDGSATCYGGRFASQLMSQATNSIGFCFDTSSDDVPVATVLDLNPITYGDIQSFSTQTPSSSYFDLGHGC
jgi:hypothetical protein